MSFGTRMMRRLTASLLYKADNIRSSTTRVDSSLIGAVFPPSATQRDVIKLPSNEAAALLDRESASARLSKITLLYVLDWQHG
jgi:hypothetical protein